MKHSSIRTVFALMLAIGLTMGSAGVAAANTVIKATNTRHWNPSTTSITRGTKVVWRNPTISTHTVNAYGGNWSKSATLAPGAKTTFTFKTAGTFRFRCTIHSTLVGGVCSGMCGKVTVG